MGDDEKLEAIHHRRAFVVPFLVPLVAMGNAQLAADLSFATVWLLTATAVVAGILAGVLLPVSLHRLGSSSWQQITAAIAAGGLGIVLLQFDPSAEVVFAVGLGLLAFLSYMPASSWRWHRDLLRS